MKFKQFLISEDTAFLGSRVGDVLNHLHDIEQNSSGIGPRQLANDVEKVVNQIRRILHTHWDEQQEKNLKLLQKVGVALMKSIEEKGDLNSVIASATDTLEGLMTDMGVPSNRMMSPQTDPQEVEDKDGVAEPKDSKLQPPKDSDQGQMPEEPRMAQPDEGQQAPPSSPSE